METDSLKRMTDALLKFIENVVENSETATRAEFEALPGVAAVLLDYFIKF